MRPKIRLVVTDLDNTLYDWVTFFATAFYEMVDVAVTLLDVDREQLLDELRDVHRKYHNSEYPFALLETKSVRARFQGASRPELAAKMDAAFHAFNAARNRTLVLYPKVEDTLAQLRDRGVPVVAHTEATEANAQFRLGKLGVAKYIERLYALEHLGEAHPTPEQIQQVDGVQTIRLIRPDERKPDPRVLRDISRDVGIPLAETLYVGDSIVRDVGMAKDAGALAAWAQYGTQFQPMHWTALVRITHWTDEDIRRADVDRKRLGATKPDYVLDTFADILAILD
jgi:phosphoglycolate phosphatase